MISTQVKFRICIFFVFIFVFTACKPSKKYFKKTISERSSGVAFEEDTLYADTDTAALHQAALSFEISRNMYKTSKYKEYLERPISFRLIDEQYNNIDSILGTAVSLRIRDEARRLAGTQDRKVDSAELLKVFGDINFFISRKEFDRLYRSGIDIGTEHYFQSGAFTLTDSLYMVDLESLSQSASYYDTETKAKWQNLIDVITAKYGDPEEARSYPAFYNMDDGFINFSHSWELGDKIIKVGVGARSSRYYASCRIYRESISKREKEMREQAEKEKISNAAKEF